MLRALLRKEFRELFNGLVQDRKRGRRRSGAGLVLYSLLFAFIVIIFAGMFGTLSYQLCRPLIDAGLDWLYFSLLGMITIAIGVLITMFSAHTALYDAKDNDLLLSLPIRPSTILFSRLFSVWTLAMGYALISLLPGTVIYWITTSASTVTVITGILLLPIISIFELALACVLGWIVAKISAHIRSKSTVTVALSLIFLIVYYAIYFRASEIIASILQNAQQLGASLDGRFNPIYLLGKAGTGDLLATAILLALVVALLILIWQVLSRSFIRLATTKRGFARRVYHEKAARVRGAGSALLRRELRRLSSSANYMLNCALGTLLMPGLGIYMLLKGQELLPILTNQLQMSADTMGMLACAAVCMCATMNDLTAPAVSLEGKNIWIVQSLPVGAWKVLRAKLNLHLVVTLPALLVCSICIALVLKTSLYFTVMLILTPAIFTLAMGCFGLVLNLLAPNLKWTNEAVPIKKSMSVGIALLGGWVFVGLLALAYYLLRSHFTPASFLLSATLLILAVACAMLLWLKTRGARKFAQL